jgi:hypothetical protein
MERHAHSERRGRGPRLGIERLLEGGSGGDGIRGACEDGEATIALAAWAHNHTVMLSDPGFDKHVVACEGEACCLGVLLPQGSTPLNIGEEKGDSAGWQVAH